MSQTIGFTYSGAIGHSYSEPLHARLMVKSRSFYDRAMEALREKYGEKSATQGKLAALAGIRQPSVNDWKDGVPHMDNGVRLATALGVCVEWLYTERGPKHPPPKDGLPWAELTDAQRAQVERFAHFVKQEK